MTHPEVRRPRVLWSLVAFAAVVSAARPALAEDAAPPPAPASAPVVTLPPPDAAAQPTTASSSTRIGLGLGAGGLLGIAVGSVFGALAISAWSNVTSACGPGGNAAQCVTKNPSQVSSDHDAAERDAAVSTVFFITGGVLLVAGGAVLIGGSHHGGGAAPTVSLAPALGPGHGGFALSGSF